MIIVLREHRHKKFGYPYKKYIDVWATEEVNNGQPQYRTASKKVGNK